MGGFREDAARHPSRASAQATGSRARCTRSAGPQNAMHARGSTPHPRRHRRRTTTTPQPTKHTRHTGRAGGNSRNDATESKELAPLNDWRRATDLPKAKAKPLTLSSPKSEAKSSLPKLLTQTQSTYTQRRSTTIRGKQIQARSRVPSWVCSRSSCICA